VNKKISIISAVLFGVGLLITFGALIAIGFNFDKIVDISKESIEIKQNFNSISLDCSSADIVIKPSSNGKCGMETVCSRGAAIKYSVERNELKIKEEIDFSRSFFYTGDNTVTIYLPKDKYKSLKIHGSSADTRIDEVDFEQAEILASAGDIVINSRINELKIKVSAGDVIINGMEARVLNITSSSGDVTIKNTSVKESATLETSTGDVKLEETVVGKNLSVKTSTGDIEAKKLSAVNLVARVSTGEIELENVVVTGEMKLNSKSGDVELDRCDAQFLKIETSSGDVEGTLLTNKIFYTKSGSGDISVPKSTEGGMCEITTGSGDVTFRFAK